MQVAACLDDIFQWMSAHHLKFNLVQSRPSCSSFQGRKSPVHDLFFNIENSVVSPARTARNLGVTLDDQLSFAANIAATSCSCKFFLHNIRRTYPLLTQKAVQALVQALVISRLDY